MRKPRAMQVPHKVEFMAARMIQNCELGEPIYIN